MTVKYSKLSEVSNSKTALILRVSFLFRYQGLVMMCRLRLKCDGTRAETRFRLSAKRTSPFKYAEASVPSTTGSRGVRISGSNAGYTMFRGSVKSTGYPLHLPVSPSLPFPCVTVCYHNSTGLYIVVMTRTAVPSSSVCGRSTRHSCKSVNHSFSSECLCFI